MPFENENLFLGAVQKYKRGWPGDTTLGAAILIFDTFFELVAPKKVELSVLERTKIFEAIVKYKMAILEREKLSLFERLKTPETVKPSLTLFDVAARDIRRRLSMSGVQFATLEMLRQKAYNIEVLEHTRKKGDTHSEKYGLTVDKVVEHLRGSEMTINFYAHEFFSGKFDPGSRYLQMWERGKTVENDPYAAKRDVTERAIFNYDGESKPSDRPSYAGINIGRRIQGAAGCSTYGCSCFVLTEEVKQRSTFTPSDSFNISNYFITNEALLQLKGKIPEEVLSQLDAIKDPGRKYKAPEFNTLLMDTLHISDIRIIATINKYMRREGTESKKIATVDRLERIVRWLSDQQMKAISEIAKNPMNVNQPVIDYVEAQIHGPINFSEDVAEIRIAKWEVEGDTKAIGNMNKFAVKHRLPVKYFDVHEI